MEFVDRNFFAVLRGSSEISPKGEGQTKISSRRFRLSAEARHILTYEADSDLLVKYLDYKQGLVSKSKIWDTTFAAPDYDITSSSVLTSDLDQRLAPVPD